MQNQKQRSAVVNHGQASLGQDHLQRCSILYGVNDEKQMFLENSQSYSSYQQQVTRKTTIHQQSFNMAPTSANETNQWQSSSACKDTTEGKKENLQLGSGQQLKNTEEDESKANQESSGVTPQESNLANIQDENTTHVNDQQPQQRLLIIQNNTNLDNKFNQQEFQQPSSNFQILPYPADQQVYHNIPLQCNNFGNQYHQQQSVHANNSCQVHQQRNNISRDSSQGNQRRFYQNSNQNVMPEDKYLPPQTQMLSSSQISAKQFHSQQYQNTIFNLQKISHNYNVLKQIGSSSGLGRTTPNKESRLSRRSKQSKESESRSYGKSSSLKRFQQQIPKKDYKDEVDSESQGVDRFSQKYLKNKPPQNILSNIKDNDDSMVHCQQQPPKSTVSFHPSSSSNVFMSYPSFQALQSSQQQPIAQLSQFYHQNQTQKQLEQRHYDDHNTIRRFHESNLSGLSHILNNLRSLTQPLDQLIQLSQKLFNNHLALQNSEEGSEAMRQLLNSAKNNGELIKRYKFSFKNSPIIEQESLNQQSSNQPDKKYTGQVPYVKFEESAVAPSIVNNRQGSSFMSHSDQIGNHVGQRRLDQPISITFKKDESSVIQKILQPYPVATNHPNVAYGHVSNLAINSSSQPNSINYIQFQRNSKPQNIAHDHRNDAQIRSSVDQNVESFEQQQSTSEIRAKAFLAQGFQLQDSVKISSQKILNNEQEAGYTSEDSYAPENMNIEQIQEDRGQALNNLNDPTQFSRFMNEFGNSKKNINDQQAFLQRGHIRKNFDIEEQKISHRNQAHSLIGAPTQQLLESVEQNVSRGPHMHDQGADIQSGQILTQANSHIGFETQFVLQFVNSYMLSQGIISQNNMNYINQLIMQTLEAPATKLDNDHKQRLQKLDKLGQRLFKQQSDLRTNSATVNNESAQRQNDSSNQDGTSQKMPQKQEIADGTKSQKLSQDHLQPDLDDTTQQDKSFTPSQMIQKLKATQSAVNQPTQIPNLSENEKTAQVQKERQSNGDIPKIFDLLLPTELQNHLAGQDDQLTQQKLSNGANERKPIQNVNINQHEQLMSSLSAFRPQNVKEAQPGLKQYISMTQTQNRSKFNSNMDQQKCQNDDDVNGQNQYSNIPQDVPNGEQRGAELLKKLLMNSKDLNGLAQLLQAKGMESQLKNLISDGKESSVMDQSSGIACVGSVNTANGIHSSGDSRIKPESGTDSGLKYQEINPSKDNKVIDHKSNSIKDYGGSSGISRHIINDSVHDKLASANNAQTQKQFDETKGSGSREGSKTNTLGSNTQQNGSTDKETRSTSIGIDKLKELIENYLPDPNNKQGINLDGNNQDVNGGVIANSLQGSNAISTLLQGQLSNGQRLSNLIKPDANHDSGMMVQQQLNNGIPLNSQDGFKTLIQQNDPIQNGQNSQDHVSSNQFQPLSQLEQANLTTQLRNQEKEISQLKTFILMNMMFGQNKGNDDASQFTQSLMQDLMMQVLKPSQNKQQMGQEASGNDYFPENLVPEIPNAQQNDASAATQGAQLLQNQAPNIGQGSNPSNVVAQLLQLQKQATSSSTPLVNILQAKLGPQTMSTNQQETSLNGNVLGKRTSFQRQELEKFNQMPTQMNKEQKDESFHNMDNDQKTQFLKNKLSMFMGPNGLQQDGNKIVRQQNSQMMAKPMDAQPVSADRKKQSTTKEQVPQFIGQKSVSATKSKENDKQLLIQSIMRQKTQNSHERQSDLCTTLHQGYLESAEHQYEGTSAFLRLKAQIKKNMLAKQFQQMKNEIMCAVNKCAPDTVLIGEKPKRPHHNMGEDSFRGSKFRGVSKNKCKWQMMIMINQKKVYIGAIHTEMEAAKYYDHIAILTQGLHSKTNFAYTAAQLEQIVNDYDFTNDKEGYYDYQSQMTSNFGSKQGTKQNLKESNFEYSLSQNRLLSKRQRIEDGPNVQESSDENQMIGDHLYSEKTANASIMGNPNTNSIAANSTEQHANIPQYDNKLQQKIQQLGFESLQHLLTSVQTQKQNQNNAESSTNQQQNSISSNLMASLVETRNKMAVGSATQANDVTQHQLQTGNQGNNMTSQQQSTQMIQKILSSYQNFQQQQQQQQMPLNAAAVQGQNETRNLDIQNLQDIRLQLEQRKKSDNIGNELFMHQKSSPHMKNLGINFGPQNPQTSINGQQMIENQQLVGNSSLQQQNFNTMKIFQAPNGGQQSSQNLQNISLNQNANNSASNAINYDSWKAIQSHASRQQVPVSMTSQQLQPKVTGSSTGVIDGAALMTGNIQAPQVSQHQQPSQAGFQMFNAQNEGASNTTNGVQNLLHMSDPMQAIDKLQQQLQKEIKIKEQQAASIALTGNQSQFEQLSQLTKSMKFKSGALVMNNNVERKENQQQFGGNKHATRQQQQTASNAQQSSVATASAHDPFRTPPQKKEDYSTEN